MRRTGEKVFGALAILAGLGIIAAAVAGVAVPRLILSLIPLVVIGWAIYHWIVVRPAPTGVERPDASPPHEGET
jgi:hypothetical protein